MKQMRIPTSRLVELLAPTLGHEKSSDVVFKSARALNFNTAFVTVTQAMQVLTQLENEPGLVGIVARLAKARLRLQGTIEKAVP